MVDSNFYEREECMMKRNLALLGVLILVLGLAASGFGKAPETTVPSTAPTTEPTTEGHDHSSWTELTGNVTITEDGNYYLSGIGAHFCRQQTQEFCSSQQLPQNLRRQLIQIKFLQFKLVLTKVDRLRRSIPHLWKRLEIPWCCDGLRRPWHWNLSR